MRTVSADECRGIYVFTEDGYTITLTIDPWRVELVVTNDFGDLIKGITLVVEAISNVLGPRWRNYKPLTLARRLYGAIDPTG